MPGTGTARGLPRNARRRAASVFALALIGGAPSAPEAQDAPDESQRPATGRFLVASEQVRGSLFRHSVVFLVNYSASGALGLIVNQRTPVPLSDVVQGAVDGAGELYVGGPVQRSSVMVLLRTQSPPDRATRVSGDVFMTVDPGILLEHTGKPGAVGDVRVYAGYAGWAPGQLEAEIARGDWIVAGGALDPIFDDAPHELWKKMHLRHHRLRALAPARWIASAR